jgi:PAS domain S-box-containing protein
MNPKKKLKLLKLLIVEDNSGDTKIHLRMLEKYLQRVYEVECVERLEEAYKKMEEIPFDLILLDLGLPDSAGLDTLLRIVEKNDEPAVVVVAGDIDEDVGFKALALGAQEYLIKGEYGGRELNKTIRYAIERKKTERIVREGERKLYTLMKNLPGMVYRSLNDDDRTMEFVSDGCYSLTGYKTEEIVKNAERSYASIIREEDRDKVVELMNNALSRKAPFKMGYCIIDSEGNEKWVWEQGQGVFSQKGDLQAIEGFIFDITERKLAEEKLEISYKKLEGTLEETVNIIATTVEARDPYTAGHQRRVAQLSSAIAKKMGLSDDLVQGVGMSGMIHDVGKIYVPIEILINPGKLGEVEFSMIKTHAQIGFDILKTMKAPWDIARIVLQHHERLDGSGYPNGLKADEIMIEAKIVAVADVVEAMASHRPYRAALGIDVALQEIKKNNGKLYDENVVAACLEVFEKGNFSFD